MRTRPRKLFLGLVAVALAGLGIVRFAPKPARAAPPSGTPEVHGAGTPVLVELFTSEGCSSCPPADAVAGRLVRTQPVAGADVIVLAHHVDYWNQLGWPDPFSNVDATNRQRAYAPIARSNYTPQAVIDGRAETVGSRGAAVEEAVAASAKIAHAKILLEASSTPSAGSERDTVTVSARIDALPAGAANDAELLLAVVQDQGRVAVTRGENHGRTLDHAAIVRSLRVVGPVAHAGGALQATEKIPSAVAAPDGSTFSVVVFVQERASRHVLGTARAPLSSHR